MEKTKNKNKLGLKIGSWNINGLSKEKWNETIFKEKIQLLDIISWDKIFWQICAQKEKDKKGRSVGGILVYYPNI